MIDCFANKGPILVLGPHPDDEIGCAGLLSKLSSVGAEIHHWFYSLCRESLHDIGSTPDMLLQECNSSREVLGVHPENCGNFDIPVRYFPDHRQEILDTMIKFRNKLKPALVLVPNSKDIHQDHNVIFNEALRAFKHTSLLGYELPWNNLSMEHKCFVELSQKNVDAKVNALECYKSQKDRIYANKDFFLSLLNVRGVQISKKYSECYELLRLII